MSHEGMSHEHESAPGQNPASFETHTDTIPNFARHPSVISKQDGNWSDGSTWSTGRVPASGDVVLISRTVTYDSTTGNVDTIGIDKGGTLTFKTDRNTKLAAANILVMPGGAFRIGTKTNPLPKNLTAEIVIKDKPLDTTDDGKGVFDPYQWGTSFVAIDGTVQIFGAVKSPTFVRLAKEPRQGDTTLDLAQAPAGWRPGDRLILPDTRAVDVNSISIRMKKELPTYQGEELSVASIDGAIVTLEAPLKFDHLGARDADGTLRFLPHVANLSRNVVIRSENPQGTRGHTAFLHRSTVDIEYALFQGLGRTRALDILNNTVVRKGAVVNIGTNEIGRYALHAHHLIGPADLPKGVPQFSFVGNAIDGSPKVGITIHDSDYGLVQYNVIYKAQGTGLLTEDGSESYNTIADNFTMTDFGTGATKYVFTRFRAAQDIAFEGSGFWFRTGNNYIRNNVAANANSSGFTFGQWRASDGDGIRIPAFKGADKHRDGEFRPIDGNTQPILEFADNEAYGFTSVGLNLQFVGTGESINNPRGLMRTEPAPDEVIHDFRVWHAGMGVSLHMANQFRFENLTVRGGREGIGSVDSRPFPAFVVNSLTLVNPDIQGAELGVRAPILFAPPSQPKKIATFGIEGGVLKNETNISIETPRPAINPASIPVRRTVISNVKFGTYGGQPLANIVTEVAGPPENNRTVGVNGIQRDEIVVKNYNGDPGTDFRVYYLAQAPGFVVPQTFKLPTSAKINYIRSPDAGLTNKESWSKYGIAIAGAIAPCTNSSTYPEIAGFVCGSDASGPGPSEEGLNRLPEATRPTSSVQRPSKREESAR